jgi:hypothetical protein
MVDDQTATFTTDILRQIKANHAVWVSRKNWPEARNRNLSDCVG